jgi:hypothetical protein
MEGHGLIADLDDDVYPMAKNKRKLCALSATERESILTPEILSKRWGISVDRAQKTIAVTTHEGIRNVFLPSERKVRKKAPWMNYPSIKGSFYTDQFFSKIKSVHGYTGGSIYTNGMGYDRFYPWVTKKEHPDTIMSFIQDVGVPQTLISDNAPEEAKGKSKDLCRTYRIQQKVTVPYSPWQNLAEASIRELKKAVRRALRRTNTPLRLWGYCGIWCCAVRRLTSNRLYT